jgi:competence protein ComEA
MPTVRFIPGWKALLLLLAPVTLALAVFAGAYAYKTSVVAAGPAGPEPPNQPANNAALEVPPPSGLLVYVSGAVEHPGLYRLKRGDRVFDAVAAAGGLRKDADRSRTPNLAGRLRDGEQIRVPFAKTATGTLLSRANLNTATLEELESVPGFTEALAKDVLDYRTNFGGFQSTRELVDILGMSEADFVIARHYLTL